ncbi:hypothetical protein [Streptomyces sp. NPDC005131]
MSSTTPPPPEATTELTPEQEALREGCMDRFWEVYARVLARMQEEGRLERIHLPPSRPSD